MNIPTYLKGFIKCNENQISICSTADNDLLEVWYYGDLFEVKGEPQPYIVDTDFAPAKIIAKDVKTGEEILVFDGAIHGYNNMFCDIYTPEQIDNRPMKKYSIPASKLIIELGYSIDYDDEKEQYDFNKNGNVILMNGAVISWEDVKCNGFDFFSLYFIDNNKNVIQFVDYELA